MSILIFVILTVTLLLLIWMFSGNQSKEQVVREKEYQKPMPLPSIRPIQPPPAREALSIPQKLRRAQQSLIRQKKIISDDFKALSHEQRKIDISSKMNQLNEKHCQVQDAALGLVRKELDISQWSSELKNREDLISIQEAQAKLLGAQFDIQVNRAENQIAGKKNELLAIGLDQENKENLIEYRARALDLQDQKLDIKKSSIRAEKNSLNNEQTRLKLIGEMNQIEKREALMEFDKRDINANRQNLQNLLEKIYNKTEGLQLQDRENKINTARRQIGIEKGKLQNLKGEILNKTDEVRVAKKDLKLTYATARQGLTTILDNIKLEYKRLDLVRFENKLISQEHKLGIIRQELSAMRQHIEQMYYIQSQLLRIESSKNDLAYRQKQTQLDQKHAATQHQIQQLQHARQNDNMKYREEKLALQSLKLSIKQGWLR